MVNFGAPVQLAESCEELWDVFAHDAHTSVPHRHSQHLLTHVVLRFELDQVAALNKLQAVFDQVDQDLLESTLVTQQIPRQPLRINAQLYLFSVGLGQENLLDKVQCFQRVKGGLHQSETAFAHLTEIEHVLDEGLHQDQLTSDYLAVAVQEVEIVLG